MISLIRYLFSAQMTLNIELLYDKIFQPQLMKKLKQSKINKDNENEDEKNKYKDEGYFKQLIIDIRGKIIEKDEDYRIGFNSIIKTKYYIFYYFIYF